MLGWSNAERICTSFLRLILRQSANTIAAGFVAGHKPRAASKMEKVQESLIKNGQEFQATDAEETSLGPLSPNLTMAYVPSKYGAKVQTTTTNRNVCECSLCLSTSFKKKVWIARGLGGKARAVPSFPKSCAVGYPQPILKQEGVLSSRQALQGLFLSVCADREKKESTARRPRSCAWWLLFPGVVCFPQRDAASCNTRNPQHHIRVRIPHSGLCPLLGSFCYWRERGRERERERESQTAAS